jgi:putative Mn2+ efflux pump MntP
MDFITLLFIAVGLSMDAFAVSISSGLTIQKLKIRHAFLIASFFGLFQGIMPVLGWLSGVGLREYIASFDHWIAFFLLSVIGGKMIYEASKLEEASKQIDPLNIYVLFLLSVATSIDALAVGLSFAFLKIVVIFPAIIIGVVTFVFSLLGVFIGDKFGHFFERKIEIIGGIILIVIGLRILFEHLST